MAREQHCSSNRMFKRQLLLERFNLIINKSLDRSVSYRESTLYVLLGGFTMMVSAVDLLSAVDLDRKIQSNAVLFP